MTAAQSGDNTGTGNIPVSQANSPLQIRPASHEDAQAICTLFRKIFPDEMTHEHWRWKYERQQSRAIVVYKKGKLVAHYGGVGTEILMNGRPSTAIQITDLMVDPQARHAVRSQSPFYLSAKTFLEKYAGHGKPFFLAYGFPSERAMALSEKLGLYETVGNMTAVQWDLNAGNNHNGNSNIIALDAANFSRYQGKIDTLWARFSKNFSNHFVCKKDADYFRWRFLDHPTRSYSLYLINGRLTKTPKYLVVLRHNNDNSMLMDVLSPSLKLGKVLSLAAGIAERENKKILVTWSSDAFLDKFLVNKATRKPLSVAIPANTGSPGYPPEQQKHKWWFMPGDTDYL